MFFEEGKAQGLFHSLKNKALYTISPEPAVALERSIRRGQLKYDKAELELVCNLCWQTTTCSTHSLDTLKV
ncbi:Transcriptional regulator, TetR family protein [Shewanella benthica]|uniref:Transcriptional regulator, TetR family protein n=1 Tax=Shewanella benthica TaxID=43661 RepID=A0A330LVC0_9GAMM|nr:hypothetical protein [Shewanella benthica]SQH74012.1 Transcriptional regulator, TetR family protein [Shewanella benthica]